MHGGKMCKAVKPLHLPLYQHKRGQIFSALEHFQNKNILSICAKTNSSFPSDMQ